MKKAEIEQFVKNYLNSKNISFEKKHEKDECSLNIKKSSNIFYIDCHRSYYQGISYPAQAEGFPCSCYTSSPSYRFVCDTNGKILIDLARISSQSWDRQDSIKRLDKENIFLPIISDDANSNNWQHFKIQNGEATLINTFGYISTLDENLLKKKLMVCDGKLYNFKKGVILCDVFDNILSDNYDLENLAKCWYMPYEKEKEFVEVIGQKMKEENLLIGYKKVQVKKDDISREYNICIFIDLKGNFVSDLYYMDDYDFTSVGNVSPENFELVIQQLNNKLISKIDALILEEEKREQILEQVKGKLSL